MSREHEIEIVWVRQPVYGLDRAIAGDWKLYAWKDGDWFVDLGDETVDRGYGTAGLSDAKAQAEAAYRRLTAAAGKSRWGLQRIGDGWALMYAGKLGSPAVTHAVDITRAEAEQLIRELQAAFPPVIESREGSQEVPE